MKMIFVRKSALKMGVLDMGIDGITKGDLPGPNMLSPCMFGEVATLRIPTDRPLNFAHAQDLVRKKGDYLLLFLILRGLVALQLRGVFNRFRRFFKSTFYFLSESRLRFFFDDKELIFNHVF